MLAILSLITILVLSLVTVRIATVALTLTGVSREMARFQARSAFTGAGFTTDESEKVVGHPVRRRIIMLLMLLGNAGIVTAVSSLILSFTGAEQSPGVTGTLWFRMTLLVVGLGVLLLASHSRWIDFWMSRVIRWALQRWTDLDTRDYASLLQLTGDYRVAELAVRHSDWLADRTLAQLRLDEEGVLVLAIQRSDGKYLGAPHGQSRIHPDDSVLVYGHRDTLASLDERRAGTRGSWEHVEAVTQQVSKRRKEDEEEEKKEASDDPNV